MLAWTSLTPLQRAAGLGWTLLMLAGLAASLGQPDAWQADTLLGLLSIGLLLAAIVLHPAAFQPMQWTLKRGAGPLPPACRWLLLAALLSLLLRSGVRLLA